MKHVAADSNNTAALDARLIRMVTDPETYFREARQRARKEAEKDVKRERELRRRRPR